MNEKDHIGRRPVPPVGAGRRQVGICRASVHGQPPVGIVAVTSDGRLLLVEQFRIPVGKNVIELPAGLVGDLPGQEEESLKLAAQRELAGRNRLCRESGSNT